MDEPNAPNAFKVEQKRIHLQDGQSHNRLMQE